MMEPEPELRPTIQEILEDRSLRLIIESQRNSVHSKRPRIHKQVSMPVDFNLSNKFPQFNDENSHPNLSAKKISEQEKLRDNALAQLRSKPLAEDIDQKSPSPDERKTPHSRLLTQATTN